MLAEFFQFIDECRLLPYPFLFDTPHDFLLSQLKNEKEFDFRPRHRRSLVRIIVSSVPLVAERDLLSLLLRHDRFRPREIDFLNRCRYLHWSVRLEWCVLSADNPLVSRRCCAVAQNRSHLSHRLK